MHAVLRRLLAAGDGGPSGSSDAYSVTMPVAAIFIILVLGLSGSLLPPLINVYLPKFNLNERYGFRFFNGLAAGLVLAVGYIHSIPDSIASFGKAYPEQNQTAQYAWGGLCAMLGSLAVFFAEEYVHRNIGRFAVVHGHHHDHHHHPQDHDHKGEHHHHEHTHKNTPTPEAVKNLDNTSDVEQVAERDIEMQLEEAPLPVIEAEKQRTSQSHLNPHTKEASYTSESTLAVTALEVGYYTEMYVLLFGLSFHSIFVGIALGVSNDWGLFAAIVFHQFFEGLALGARVARAGFRSKAHIWFLDLIYALSAPIGIAIGIGIQSAIVGDDTTYNCVNGIFQGLSAGILVYVALIHMMKEEIERPEFKCGGPLLYVMYAGFLAGAGVMAVIGIWA